MYGIFPWDSEICEKGVVAVARNIVRSAASALIWIGAIEVVSSFFVKQFFSFDLSFTPYFLGLGLLGLVVLVLSRFF